MTAPSNSIRTTPAFNNRGIVYDHKGEYDRAIADYDRAIELVPNDATAYNNRGVAYGKKGDYDRAIRDYDQAIRLKPDHANAFINRGTICFLRETTFSARIHPGFGTSLPKQGATTPSAAGDST